ncbi:MAG: fructose-bisphosphatase class II [Candidatus Krumholzibacteria bacterium]|nr:fructose-bisphosphatase class II [Candidatus Krumholzibacteria bacterium]
MDRNLALELVRVTEAAALAAARLQGKGDPIAADRAASAAMELAIRNAKITGHIVIGERDDIPDAVLGRGRTVGTGDEPEVDIALDPLEGMASLADGQSNAISAIALGPRGGFRYFDAPFMRKLAVSADAADAIDIREPVFDTLVKIAGTKRVYVEDLTVAILDCERHDTLIDEVRRAGARIELVRDGDLAAAIAAALPGTGIDVMMGTGDTRQGVIAAAALACIGGGFQGELVRDDTGPHDGEGDYGRVFRAGDLTGGSNIMFAVTGVTRSAFLDGVSFRPGGAVTHSLVLRSRSGTIRTLRTEHFFDKEPDYT